MFDVRLSTSIPTACDEQHAAADIRVECARPERACIAFYRSIGAVAMDEWVRYRLAGEALANFAGGSGPGAGA